MKQTDQDVDEALAYIQQSTAAPIQRFFYSIVAAPFEETVGRQNSQTAGRPKLSLLLAAKGFSKPIETLCSFLKRILPVRPVLRVLRPIGRTELPRDRK